MVSSIDGPLEAWLERGGRIVRAFRRQGSGCASFVAEMDGRRAFFKQARTKRAAAGLERVVRVYERVRHVALPPLWGYWMASDGPLLVFEWVGGEPLHVPQARARFRALPQAEALAALDTILDLHLSLAERGFVSCDFHDGSVLYDFDARRAWGVDLDEYREGAFRVTRKRMPGATRFMAPEEWRRGGHVDERTTVFHMGRAALVLLGDFSGDPAAWRGPDPLRAVAERAAAPLPADRFPSMSAFVGDWRRACGGGRMLPAVLG